MAQTYSFVQWHLALCAVYGLFLNIGENVLLDQEQKPVIMDKMPLEDSFSADWLELVWWSPCWYNNIGIRA